jgi:nanoRNase/pAp phosphatase (c-di-AMP/oligoRNAs hydrolase)
LKYLLENKAGVDGEIVYQGVIGRAENIALVGYLDVPMTRLPNEDVSIPDNFALIDTNAQAKNNPMPEGKRPIIVIDHHTNKDEGHGAFTDIRPSIGATSTMMTQYLQAANCEPPPKLATALLYGIKTDTLALSRNTTRADVNAYCYLSSMADIEAFLSFEQAEVPIGYFKGLASAMKNARAFENGLVVTFIKDLPYPDLVAEIADLFLRLNGSRYIIVLGLFEKRIHFSIRVKEENFDVNELAQVMAGEKGNAGGREQIAGGLIPLGDEAPDDQIDAVYGRIRDYFEISAEEIGQLLTDHKN